MIKLSTMLIFYQNVNRLRSKLKDFYLSVLNSNFDIVCVTESNLVSTVCDSEILDSRYNTFRRDRDRITSHKTTGGGVLIGVKKDYVVYRVTEWESDVECIRVNIVNMLIVD